MGHGPQRLGGAVGQSLPQVEDLDERQDAQVCAQTAAPQLLSLATRTQTRVRFTLRPDASSKTAYPLHGKELDLIGPAFEEPEDVPEDRHGPLQVARGPLADYTRRCVRDDLTQQQQEQSSPWSPPVK